MKTFKPLFAAFIRFPIYALLLAGAPVSTAMAEISPDKAANDRTTNRISAADPRFFYEGRFDFSDSNAPVVIWQASRISLDFEGNTLALLFDDARGQCFFNAQVDNSNTVVEVLEGKPPSPAVLSHLGIGRHHLVLFKRSEARAGTARFRGIEFRPAAQAWSPPIINHKLKLEFIGDSITVGACNEDGAADQWDNCRTHNSAFSYAALTADRRFA